MRLCFQTTVSFSLALTKQATREGFAPRGTPNSQERLARFIVCVGPCREFPHMEIYGRDHPRGGSTTANLPERVMSG